MIIETRNNDVYSRCSCTLLYSLTYKHAVNRGRTKLFQRKKQKNNSRARNLYLIAKVRKVVKFLIIGVNKKTLGEIKIHRVSTRLCELSKLKQSFEIISHDSRNIAKMAKPPLKSK